MVDALLAMASVVLDPYLIMLIFGTTVLGVIIGVLPGLGATTGAALLLPFTLTMMPVHAITVLATIYVSATFAGSFIGVLPAEGATVASMIGYAEARRWSKNKEEFGKGAVEGIAGAEAANNAATGGAMVPTMVLGIPGSGTTAVILVGLMVHGLRPGPYLFTEQVDKVYQIFGAMLLANIMFMAMGLYAAKLFARISLVPTPILWPVVFALSVIGAYALSASLLDVWIVLIFGVVGFFARRHGFAVAPIAVGLILGEMVETNLQNSLEMFDGQWWPILTQPLAALFLILAFLGLCGPWMFQRLVARRG